MTPYFLFLLLAVLLANACSAANHCYTCDGICDCLLNPATPQKCHHHHSHCFTVKLNDGQIVKKGCAIDCLEQETYGQPCEMCRGRLCNSEEPLQNSDEVEGCSNSVRRRSIGEGVKVGSGGNIGGGVRVDTGRGIGGGASVKVDDGNINLPPQPAPSIGGGIGVNVGGGIGARRHHARRDAPRQNQQRVGQGVYLDAPRPNNEWVDDDGDAAAFRSGKGSGNIGRGVSVGGNDARSEIGGSVRIDSGRGIGGGVALDADEDDVIYQQKPAPSVGGGASVNVGGGVGARRHHARRDAPRQDQQRVGQGVYMDVPRPNNEYGDADSFRLGKGSDNIDRGVSVGGDSARSEIGGGVRIDSGRGIGGGVSLDADADDVIYPQQPAPSIGGGASVSVGGGVGARRHHHHHHARDAPRPNYGFDPASRSSQQAIGQGVYIQPQPIGPPPPVPYPQQPYSPAVIGQGVRVAPQREIGQGVELRNGAGARSGSFASGLGSTLSMIAFALVIFV